MAILIGNHGPYTRRHGNGPAGVGTQNVGPIIGAWEQVAGKSGDVIPVNVDQVAYQQMKIGTFIQSSAAVTIKYSLDGIALAGSADPQIRANATWTAAQSVAAGAIVQSEAVLFTVAEITFGADGIVSFYSR